MTKLYSLIASRLLPLFMAVLIFTPQHAAAQRLSAQDQEDLSRIQAYVNSLTTLTTDFTQISPRGRVSRGQIYISRPGKLRVQFNPPRKLVIQTTRLWLVVSDGSGAKPQYFPLSSSPAGILVRKDIRFTGGDLRVTRVRRVNQHITVTLVKRKSPGQGAMALIFLRNPLKLVGWVVIDAQGNRTRVSLSNIRLGIGIDKKKFYIPNTSTPGNSPFDQ